MKRLYLAIINKFFGNKLAIEDSLIFYNGIRKSIVVQAFSYFFIFLSSVIMVRLAGIPEYGIYANIFNWISLLTVISCFGMEDVVLALIPEQFRKNNTSAVVSIVTKANKTILIVSALSSLVFITIAFSGIVPAFSQYKFLWLIGIVNVYFGSFIIVNQQTLQAFNRFYLSQSIDKVLRPSLLVLLLATFWFSRKNVDARILILFNTVVLSICCIVLVYFVRSTLNKLPKQLNSEFEKPSIFGENLYFALISVFVLLKSKIILLILGSMNETDEVGILNIAYRLADFVLLPYMLIHAVVPQLFSSHRHSELGYRKKLFDKANQVILIGALPIMLFFVAFGKLVLKLYDPALQEYYLILLILCGSQFLYSVFGPCTALLMMQGKQKQAAWAMLVDIVLNSLLFFVFIGWLGLMGAAVASFLGSLFYNILMRVLVTRYLYSANI